MYAFTVLEEKLSDALYPKLMFGDEGDL